MATWTQILRQTTTGWPPLHLPTVSARSTQLTLCILTSVLAPLELSFTALKREFVFSEASAAFTEPLHDDDEVQCGVKEEWAQARQEPAKSPEIGRAVV